MAKQHHYSLTTTWQGNKGSGTSRVSAYGRDHTVTMPNKPELHLTTDNALYGDASVHNPEDLLVAAISSCHMLSFLYLCALEGIVVMDYTDAATGKMEERASGGGQFTEVVLHPVFSVTEARMVERAIELHVKAHEICFIANSVNFPVLNEPSCNVFRG